MRVGRIRFLPKGPAKAFSIFCERRDFTNSGAHDFVAFSERGGRQRRIRTIWRVRVMQVVEGGVAAAVRQFVIGNSAAIGSVSAGGGTGSIEAESNKGQSRSPLKKYEEWFLELVRQEPDLTLEDIQRRLPDQRRQ
jgi:hypothetical protein